jgi:hypothetical protein
LRDNQLKVVGLQSLLSGLSQNESMTQLDLDQTPAYLVSKTPYRISMNASYELKYFRKPMLKRVTIRQP